MELTIEQAAKYLSVHKDTLRRWEKKGEFVSKRKGNRNDRVYVLEDLKVFKFKLEVEKFLVAKESEVVLDSLVEKYRSELVQFLSNLVRVPSVNGENNEREIADFIYNHALGLDLPAKIVGKDMNRPNIFIGKGFDSKKSMLFVAHLDTVATGDHSLWKYNPFEGKIINNRLYGRGSADNKAGIALSIYALKILDSLGFGRVAKFVGGSDEEAGAQSDIGILNLLEKGLNGSGAIYTYPGRESIGIGSRGLIRLVIRCTGEQAHTGLSDWTLGKKGVNAIDGVIKLIRVLEDFKFNDSRADFGGLTSKVTVTKISGGIGESIVPPSAEALVDIRLMPGINNNDIIKSIRSVAKELEKKFGYVFTVHIKNNGPSWIIDKELELVKILKTQVSKEFGYIPKVKGRGPFNEGGFITQAGIPTIGGFSINGDNVHGVDEYVELSDIPAVLKIYIKTALYMFVHQSKKM